MSRRGVQIMEIDQLRHFLKVAELGNFTRAAEAIGLSQSALSRSVSRLEEELGQPVLERQTRNVTLTEAGKLLHDRARQIVSLVDDTVAEIADDGQTGQIRIAAIPTIAPFFLPSFLQKFGASFSKATVIVQEDTTDQLLGRLSEGEIDVAIMARPVDAKYLKTEDLFEEELFLVMSATNPLCEKKQIPMSEIETLPFVLLGEAHCLTDNIVSFCRQKSFHPVSVERTSQLATVQELVSLNHGVSMIPAMARVLDNSPRRIYRSIFGRKPSRKIIMVFNPYRYQSRLLESCKNLLRKYALDFVKKGATD
jgi:LysR family hydrogen peroxide-inducible transcriptional activator